MGGYKNVTLSLNRAQQLQNDVGGQPRQQDLQREAGRRAGPRNDLSAVSDDAPGGFPLPVSPSILHPQSSAGPVARSSEWRASGGVSRGTAWSPKRTTAVSMNLLKEHEREETGEGETLGPVEGDLGMTGGGSSSFSGLRFETVVARSASEGLLRAQRDAAIQANPLLAASSGSGRGHGGEGRRGQSSKNSVTFGGASTSLDFLPGSARGGTPDLFPSLGSPGGLSQQRTSPVGVLTLSGSSRRHGSE
uniref:Uncharacterized protein n=1 Tax=Chromera velia CCMP2878 TaxID=1169474 RepID=A0A0G4GQ39_9ALVE|eukprot:Cvel_5039.t1-p1 / transcript=Cvel_5039.t1 / gene=Cvel_5039 / organism=Chromera_velia_CCMP2878 / gene_product=hypothetical protein / transcript_product=hypothetical protein / location=Cvel_scaffold229:80845-85230(-) / protein_length=247 / sequence_SO=supercontig / SO=protein_coding / is_pseudo=false